MSESKTKEGQLLLSIVVLFWFSQYVYIPYQTPYLTAINVSSQFLGVIIGAYGIAQLLLRLPVGVLADRQSDHKLFIALGLVAASSASLVRIFLPSGSGFLLANILSGVASATWISFMILYLSFYNKEEQAVATSTLVLANNLGILLGFVTSTLLYDHVGMKLICGFSATAAAIGFALALKLAPTKQPVTSLTIKQLLEVGADKQLLFFAALALIQQGIQMSTTMSFTTQIIKDLGASNTMVGVATIIYMLAAVSFARLNKGPWLQKQRTTVLVSTLFLALAAYCYLVPLVPSVALICLLQLIPGAATGILFSRLTSEAMKHVPVTKKSTAMGYFQAIYALGMTLFPIFSGQIKQLYTVQRAYLLLALLAAIGAGAILLRSAKKAS